MKKLNKEIEQKGLLPETQSGFRKKRSTMDNINLLQHLLGKKIERGGGRVSTFFVDFQAAFESLEL